MKLSTDLLATSGLRLGQLAARRGLLVTRPDGSTVPIGIGALPLVVDDGEIAARATLARRLVAAVAKAARWRLATEPDAVLAALGPAERRLVAATRDRALRLAVARVDFFGRNALSALEVNATIPAMQGYSDIAAASWLEAFAGEHPDWRGLVAANGTNTDALLDALLELNDRERGARPATIALLCREGDAQITELAWIRDRFCGRGFDTRIVHPRDLHWDGAWLRTSGVRLELVYRHLFLSRLDGHPSAPLEEALTHDAKRGSLVLNPPAPHLEMKDTLALLSQAADSDELSCALGLDAEERDSIVAHVPWTRRLASSGAPLDVDVGEVAARPDEFVLKRSWSYGGRDVFVGAARATTAFAEALAETFPGVSRWHELVAAAATDQRRGGFVVQRAVPIARTPQWLCSPTAVRHEFVATDYAAFASLGSAPAWSGVARASASEVVNIVRGGAVVPVLRASVARRVAELAGRQESALIAAELLSATGGMT